MENQKAVNIEYFRYLFTSHVPHFPQFPKVLFSAYAPQRRTEPDNSYLHAICHERLHFVSECGVAEERSQDVERVDLQRNEASRGAPENRLFIMHYSLKASFPPTAKDAQPYQGEAFLCGRLHNRLRSDVEKNLHDTVQR